MKSCLKCACLTCETQMCDNDCLAEAVEGERTLEGVCINYKRVCPEHLAFEFEITFEEEEGEELC